MLTKESYNQSSFHALILAIGFGLTLHSIGPLEAAEKKIKTDIDLTHQWKDAKGARIELGWEVESGWVWAGRTDSIPVQSPMIRTVVEAPGDVAIQSFTGTNASFEKDSDTTLVIKTAQPISEILIQAKTGNTITTYTLVISLEYTEPFLWIHKSCGEAGMVILPKEGDAKFLYTSIVCVPREDSTGVYIIISKDSSWGRVNLGLPKSQGPNWREFDIPKNEEAKGKVGDFIVRGGGGNKRYVFNYDDPGGGFIAKALELMEYDVGANFTYLAYEEDLVGVNMKEIGLTLKGATKLWVIPDKIDASFSAYFNGLAITKSPSSIPTPMFYGINLRGGYVLPKKVLRMTLKTSLGFYYWGMIVSDNSYGISSLVGPQIFISLDGVPSFLRRPMWLYLKFAPLESNNSSYSIQKSEIAAGAGYLLLPWRRGAPGREYFLTLDASLAKTATTVANADNTMTLMTFSLGLQTTFGKKTNDDDDDDESN